jgi:L-methionine (R)-S-oxide reductase
MDADEPGIDREDASTALAAIIARLGAETGTIHWIGPDGLLHLVAASPGLPEAVIAAVRTIPVGKGMAGLAVARGEPVSACNIQSDTSGDVRPGARATGLAGAVVVPIYDGARVVGALGVANRAERSFTPEELDTLLAAGRRLAAEALCVESRH